MLTFGKYSVRFNNPYRVWEVIGGKAPQRFQSGAIGRQAALRHAISQAFPEVATAVDHLCTQHEDAAGRAWAAAQLLVGHHTQEPGHRDPPDCVARVTTQRPGRSRKYYLIRAFKGHLICSCPDYERGGVIINDSNYCKHTLTFLLSRHLQWPLQPNPENPDPQPKNRQPGGQWRGRVATRVNGTRRVPLAGVPAGVPAFANGEIVPFQHRQAYATFVATIGRAPDDQEKLVSWFYGR